MGEPLPPPPGAPILLFLLSLAGSGRGQLHLEKTLLHKEQLSCGGIRPVPLQQLFRYGKTLPVAAGKLRLLSQHRRTLLWPGSPPHPPPTRSGPRLVERSRPGQDGEGNVLQAPLSSREEEEGAVKLDDPARGPPPKTPASSRAPPSQLPPNFTEVRAVLRQATCGCPGSRHPPSPAQLGKEVEGQRGGLRHVPTPRTEEAAWAASALTFLLVVLTLAVLYTRLHRKCHRGPSLYWRASGEEGQETVAAVLKRRLFSQRRRRKRPRRPPQQQQAQPLLSSSSSGGSA